MRNDEFKAFTDRLMGLGIKARDIADALDVSENLVARARMTGPESRRPPEGWESKLHALAAARAAELQDLADML